MNSQNIRSSRINTLYKQAKSGKYTWDDLQTLAESTGVSKSTAKTYVDAVYSRLKKEGLLD